MVFEDIWRDRYQKGDESYDESLRRVANFCAKDKKESEDFYRIMRDRLFFPGGRTMSNAGIGRDLTLNNCFVAPAMTEDSLEQIFDRVALGARTHQRGGGIGYDFSQLRPKNSPTSNDAIASGPVSFMDVFNAQTATILQGNRRGANMGVMSVYHPDIEEFINAKSYEAGRLVHFNLSVMVDDAFMNAVKNDETIMQHFPVYNKYGVIENSPDNWTHQKEVNARYLWDLIMKKAYDNGEPGIFQYDAMNRDNNLWYQERIVCSNPCGEYLAGTVYGNNPQTGEPLNPDDYGGACNLGSLFLHNFVDEPFTEVARIDTEKLKNAIGIAVRFLDNIIDVNKFPDVIYQNYQKAFRTIGVGVTGLGDMLVMMGLKYNSDEAQFFVNGLMNFIAKEIYKASIELAKERGRFPFFSKKIVESGFLQKHADGDAEWKEIVEDIKKYGLRNGKMMAIAPTGTLSLTFGNNCSSGLEPIFSLEYERKVKMHGQSDDDIEIKTMRDYAYGKWLEFKDDPRCVVGKDVFVTALDMDVQDHINMLAVIAYHVDMSCSKTINVPTDYSFEKTKEIYEKCWELGIKGCTIFRPNEIRQGIMITDSGSKKEANNQGYELGRGFIIKADDNCVGLKRTLQTGCGTLHCSAFFDPDTGDALELYLSRGSTGGCALFMTGLSRMVSLSLRGGVDIYSIVDQLQSAGVCPSYAVRSATKHDTSKGSCCPTAIGYALLDMYNEMQEIIGVENDDDEVVVKAVQQKSHDKVEFTEEPEGSKCPECGEPLLHEGGCDICKSCGYTHCD